MLPGALPGMARRGKHHPENDPLEKGPLEKGSLEKGPLAQNPLEKDQQGRGNVASGLAVATPEAK